MAEKPTDMPIIMWRKSLGCEIDFLRGVQRADPWPSPTDSRSEQNVMLLTFVDFELRIAFADPSSFEEVFSALTDQCNVNSARANSSTPEKTSNQLSMVQLQSLKNAEYQVAIKQEQMLQLYTFLKFKEGCTIVEKLMSLTTKELARSAFNRWTQCIKQINNDSMTLDRQRWRLHAASNQDLDLQAWYHAVFYQEVYRLRGPFWHKDAVLPVYRQSYDLVDNGLTPLEEAALAHVLCSPDTSYGDVAGQMFVVQAIANQNQFSLFNCLASQGAQVIKYPRSGRPAKKMFRFSFVEGNIYLTWKGKFGNQGVDLGEVSAITAGIATDVLKKAGQSSRSDTYLSVVCSGRSVDLCFDTVDERNNWKELLGILVQKEQGQLEGVSTMLAQLEEEDPEPFEYFLLYSSLGENSLRAEIVKKLMRLSIS
jgi:hypothetical protein